MNVLTGQKILSKESEGYRHLHTSPEGQPSSILEGFSLWCSCLLKGDLGEGM